MKSGETLAAFDQMQRHLILEAVESGEDARIAIQRIKEETRPEYLQLLSVADPAFEKRPRSIVLQ